ncbi:MAG: hypothetical protein HY684_05250 [Chloroflexi bacterium]|nr:hypothetical protein [Chloroflexota bacterium]
MFSHQRLFLLALSKVLLATVVVSMVAAACAPTATPPPAPSAPAAPAAPAPAPSPTARPATSAPAPAATPTPARVAAPAATPAPQVKRSGTLHLITTSNPAHWDPQREVGVAAFWMYLGEFLLNFQPKDGSPAPELVERWDFLNDTTLVLHLRKGVKFHNKPPVNAREFTAQDVVWNLERIRRPGASYVWKSNLERLGKIEAVDKYTVRLTLKSVFAPVLFYLRGNYTANMAMIAKEVEDKLGEDGYKDLNNAIGTGPFMVQRFTPGISGLAVRNPDYWRPGLPYLDAVDFTIVPDKATTIAAYRTGKAEFPMNSDSFFSLPEKEQIERSTSNILFTPRADPYVLGVVPNVNKPPFTDIRLRKAMFLAMDREEALKVNLGGGGYIVGPLDWKVYPGWTWTYEELMKREGFRPKNTPEGQKDIEEAQRLMRELGYGPDNHLKIQAEGCTCFQFINLTNMEIAKSQLQKIWIDISIRIYDSAQWFEQDSSGNFLFRARGYSGPQEPDGQLYTRHHSTGGRNFQKLKDAEVDKLLDEQRRTLDSQKRKKTMMQVQERLWNLYPQVWLHTRNAYIPQQKWVKGLEVTDYKAWGDPATTWIDK